MSKLNKASVFALTAILAVAPMALAAGAGSPKSAGQYGEQAQSTRPSTGAGSTHGAQQGTQSSMGMTDANAIRATVAEVNQQRETVKLRMQQGDTVELKVPSGMLSNLNTGDSVQVSIHKADKQPGMSGTGQSSQPGSGSGTSGTMQPSSPGSSSPGSR